MDTRNAQILASLRTPKTYQELSDEFGVGYHTIRQYVQSLVDLGFVEEMPWCKQGTNQKQFISRVSNPENQFSPEGCAVMKFINGKMYTPESIVTEDDLSYLQALIEIPMLALSVPMWEFKTKVLGDGFSASDPSPEVVAEKLAVVHEALVAYIGFIEQLISVGTWDSAHPEYNSVLFHKDPALVNWDKVKTAYSRIQQIAEERNW